MHLPFVSFCSHSINCWLLDKIWRNCICFLLLEICFKDSISHTSTRLKSFSVKSLWLNTYNKPNSYVQENKTIYQVSSNDKAAHTKMWRQSDSNIATVQLNSNLMLAHVSIAETWFILSWLWVHEWVSDNLWQTTSVRHIKLLEWSLTV